MRVGPYNVDYVNQRGHAKRKTSAQSAQQMDRKIGFEEDFPIDPLEKSSICMENLLPSHPDFLHRLKSFTSHSIRVATWVLIGAGIASGVWSYFLIQKIGSHWSAFEQPATNLNRYYPDPAFWYQENRDAN